ncbi:putative monovalent cation/H+ antiporter subunit A [Jiella sp. MQZ9-1]|uniref:Monovalent cation/H+ antiporter subunit A n=1 Tax=Jiella flava TaxID=2816857 RepID=A0A939JXN0_9HYPH|nr:putative monovalent cation/H+ antiporter subunit A [Jiella flava]MBO0663531.1 putative monovalent cation/H+ antiporter subunit A [Jiella flava]MCD2472106.1 putative monovalent cation/H+ antiporter subunit A [Jiella flava]
MAQIEATTGGTLALALPFIAAALAPIFKRLFKHHAAWILALAPALAFAILFSFLPSIANGGVIQFGYDWIPAFDIRFSFRIDGLASTFALLITGIGTLIVLYSGGYLQGHRDQERFFSFILMFMGSMLGLVLADDLMTLFVYWELTSITSFLLIGFDHDREKARRGAIQALAITGGGGLALLAGFILIRELAGFNSMSEILAAGDALRTSPYYTAIFFLVLAGAFTKSAQMPFHVWLPNAMEAPTPVSAYLHSATMVKAGVYLLLRMQPALGDTALWTTILPIFGAVTLVMGALLAVRATDIKITLAYTTVSSLGLLVMLIGVGTEGAIEGAVLYLIAHSLFKGGLFMVAGSVDHGAHTREIDRLGGLAKHMPITFVAALFCAFSMGGVTPFIGFLAKETLYHALEQGDAYHVALMASAILGNALMFAAAFIVALKPFVGKLPAAIHHPHEGALTIWLGPIVLGALSLLGALFYGTYHSLFSSPMASAAIGKPVAIDIGWMPHLNLAFALSMATIALGIAIYLGSNGLRRATNRVLDAIGWGPDRGFDQAMRGLLRVSFWITRRLQSGRLDYYMTVTVIAMVAALFVPMIVGKALPVAPEMPQLRFYEWLVLVLILVGIVAVVIAKNRLTAIVSLGIQGFAVALIFMLLGAPDLSFTQFMVETLSVVILALVMTRLKLSPADHRPWRETLPDAAIAAAGGAGFGLFLLSITQRPFDPLLSSFFERYSYAIAHGHNIVNVIIVDFRGVDTMGEIAVVMTTGLAVLALIRIRVAKRNRPLPDPTEATP